MEKKKEFMNRADLVWLECLELIKDNVTHQSYRTWFLPLRPINLENNILTIEVPSPFFYEWLEEHYISLLRKTVHHILGKNAQLEYLVIGKKIVTFSLEDKIGKQSIISISSRVNDRMIMYFSKYPNELKTMNRRLFEEFIAELFDGFGFDIELTKRTRDNGRDIIAIKNVETEIKYLIECKRPDPGNPIRIRPVRELFGVKQDEKATKAILATTSYFTKDAILFSERNKWELELKDFSGVVKWIEEYRRIKEIT